MVCLLTFFNHLISSLSFRIQQLRTANYRCHKELYEAIIILNYCTEDITSAREAINVYLALQAVITILLFACALLYLPECPNDAPSVAATTKRHSFLLGIKVISKYPSSRYFLRSSYTSNVYTVQCTLCTVCKTIVNHICSV